MPVEYTAAEDTQRVPRYFGGPAPDRTAEAEFVDAPIQFCGGRNGILKGESGKPAEPGGVLRNHRGQVRTPSSGSSRRTPVHQAWRSRSPGSPAPPPRP